jgi:hypothetical protein
MAISNCSFSPTSENLLTRSSHPPLAQASTLVFIPARAKMLTLATGINQNIVEIMAIVGRQDLNEKL